jgi:hypothetical protein
MVTDPDGGVVVLLLIDFLHWEQEINATRATDDIFFTTLIKTEFVISGAKTMPQSYQNCRLTGKNT